MTHVKHAIVSDNAGRAELEAAMGRLREKRAACVINSTRLEIDADVDECVERWKLAPA